MGGIAPPGGDELYLSLLEMPARDRGRTQVTYGPAVMEGLNKKIAFVKDPDGYQIELVERPNDWLS